MLQQEPSLATTREFWDANPCGVHAGYEIQRKQRYAMEPWLPPLLASIGRTHRSILEIGCGRGVDAIELCKSMAQGGEYVGVDYSANSVAIAERNAAEASAQLRVRPRYCVANAEKLQFADASFDAVYSMGVIHHTADDAAAIREVRRVLRPSGNAYISLYRRPSLKVGTALALRQAQRALDFALDSDRSLYRFLRRRGSHSRLFGTMFLECFGVPYMNWYTRSQLRDLFAEFAEVELASFGANLGRFSPGGARSTRFGYFWLVKAAKSVAVPFRP